MITIYIMVAVVIFALGMFFMFAYMYDEMIGIDEPLVFVRAVCLFLFGSIIIALLWPVILISIVPIALVYGAVTMVKVLKHGNIDY